MNYFRSARNKFRHFFDFVMTFFGFITINSYLRVKLFNDA